jgi:hypothetical protein
VSGQGSGQLESNSPSDDDEPDADLVMADARFGFKEGNHRRICALDYYEATKRGGWEKGKIIFL